MPEANSRNCPDDSLRRILLANQRYSIRHHRRNAYSSGIEHYSSSTDEDDETPAAESDSDSESEAVLSRPDVTCNQYICLDPLVTTPKLMSTIFRPDSEFKGMQRSERQNYDVNVSLKHVDMAASFVEGYLSIQGLTEDHPTLTTFFQGEIIGHGRYTFTDTARAWGSSEKNDLKHWQEFPGFNKSLLREKLKASDRYVFMRWKEFFLVPDHKVTKLNGASFEGFYYICFDQKERKIDGCYYHKKSARDQKLELRWVDDRGRTPAWEFC